MNIKIQLKKKNGPLENSYIKYLIFGFGVSGKSSYKYLKSIGKDVKVVNSGPVESWWQEGASRRDCLSQETEEAKHAISLADIIVLSPGIPRSHPLMGNIRARLPMIR